MKRVLCLLLAVLTVLSLGSCTNGTESAETTEATEISLEKVEITDELMAQILSFRNEERWHVTSTALRSIVDDEDEDTIQGSYIGFDGSMIPSEKGNMYKGDTIAMNNVFAFTIENEVYYYDGWCYQIYRDPSVEELNTYERYETTEEYFLWDYDGILPTFASEDEIKGGEAQRNKDGVVMVNVPLKDGRARDELLADLEQVADNNGVSVDDISIDAAVVSYAVKDGKLVEFIGTYELSFYVEGGAHRVFTFEKSVVINAVGDEVEDFTLPEGYEDYEVITYE